MPWATRFPSGLGAARSLICSLACAACASSPAPAPSSPGAPASTAPPAHTVSAVVLVNGCALYGADNARLAESAINQLVDGCGSFSGDRVQFTATLLPGGAIQFESKAGASASIPLCVLSHPLSHKVKLQKACSLDVRLEEGTMALPRPADGGP